MSDLISWYFYILPYNKKKKKTYEWHSSKLVRANMSWIWHTEPVFPGFQCSTVNCMWVCYLIKVMQCAVASSSWDEPCVFHATPQPSDAGTDQWRVPIYSHTHTHIHTASHDLFPQLKQIPHTAGHKDLRARTRNYSYIHSWLTHVICNLCN